MLISISVISIMQTMRISHLASFVGISFSLVYSVMPVGGQTPQLKATASDEIHSAFVADENNLRKLVELIRKRMEEQVSNFKLKFTVTFADKSYYDTANPELIYKEENPRTRKIVAFAVMARPLVRSPGATTKGDLDPDETAEPEIGLKLESGKLSYLIRGSNRDWVLNTHSDIRERFSNMVVHSWRGKYFLTVIFGVAGGFGTFLPGAVWWRNRYDREQRQSDPDHKRTSLRVYILGGVRDPDFTGIAAFTFLNGTLMAGVVLGFVGNLLDQYLFPDTVFAMGEQLKAYEDVKSLRTTLLWGLGIAFVVGLISSILANRFSGAPR